ncbi:MAG: dTMP kinase [Clostridia bacterium]|nr:dTMP kinase [Clostridia bacterium]
MKGKFITFEGCEGSGKSTQLRLLSEYLTEHGVDFIMTREPGGSEISEEIRSIILNGKNTAMCDECEALLYAAARIQHLKEKVAPALERGKLVICDRYVDSSLAYQGYARGLGTEYVANINAFALEKFNPDLTVFLDISPADAFNRKHGADKNDRIEQLGLEFHQKVYSGYKSLLPVYPRICAVDCSGTKFETSEKIIKLLKAKDIIK